MGPDWTPLRTALRDGTLQRGDEAAGSVATRWEHLLQHLSLSLAARLGSDVHPVLTRKEAKDPSSRTSALSRDLTDTGTLAGAIAIPNAVGDLAVSADLKSMVASASVTVDAPELAQPRVRLNWLLRQLKSAPDSLRIDVAFARTQFTSSELLGTVRSNPKTLLGGTDHLPRSFTVARTKKIGTKRRTGSGSFVGDMEQLVDEFYREVVQGLKAWTPPAPQLAEEKAEAEEESALPPDAPAVGS